MSSTPVFTKSEAKKYLKNFSWTIHPLNGKVPTVKGWEKLTVETCMEYLHPTGNIGLVCGEASGVIVLDLDLMKGDDAEKGKKDGMKKYLQLVKKYGDPKTVTARTGSGGMHVYFQYTDRVKHWDNAANFYKIEEGGSYKWDLKTNRGQVVLPPSVHPDTNNPYEWIRSPFKSQVKEVPDWLFKIIDKHLNRELARKKTKKPAKEQKKKTEKSKEGEDRTEELKQLLAMLDDERADDNIQWSKVSYILKHCGEEDGDADKYYDLWEDFSRRSDKFDDREDPKKWNSWKPNSSLTIGTLKAFAKEDNPSAYASLYGNQLLTKSICKNLFRDQEGHADIFAEYYLDVVYTVDPKKGDGYIYNRESKLWVKTAAAQIQNMIPSLLEKIIMKYRAHQSNKQSECKDKTEREKIEKSIEELSKLLKSVRNAKHARDVFSLAKTKVYNPDFFMKLNTDKYLLPILGGKCVDLKTGHTVTRRKEHMFSFECNVRMGDAKCKKVKKFFNDIMRDDKEKIAYLQKVMGYWITGDTSMRSLFILWGIGQNGKSIILQILEAILGQFSVTVSKDVFIKSASSNRHAGAATPHLIPLVGARFASFSETEIKEKLNEGTLKMLTGNDTISARPNYGEQFNFRPVCKLALITNFKPEITIRDQAMLDRIKYIPFETRFVANPKTPNERKKDTAFIAELVDPNNVYLSNIFAWMVEGARLYFEEGIETPECLQEKLDEYINELDTVQNFFDDYAEPEDKEKIQMSDMYCEFRMWCKENAETYSIQREFTSTLKGKGYDIRKSNGKTWLYGYKKKEEVEEEE